jgi:uncharacterized protein
MLFHKEEAMKNSVFKSIFLSLGLLAGAGLTGSLALVAQAEITQSKALVDAAKAKGIVGERYDGYLGFVSSSSDQALKAAVDELNKGRRQVYAEADQKNNVPTGAAGASAFTNFIFPRLPSGYYYLASNNQWMIK